MNYILVFLLLALSLQCGRCVTNDAPKNTENDSENVNNNENVINKSGNEVVNGEKEHKDVDHVTEKPDKSVPSNTLPDFHNVTKNITELQKGDESLYDRVKKNKDMLMRTFYVLLGVTSIVVLYFVIRAWRSKRRHGKSRRYGLITTSGADLEMEPLDQDVDDDDEMTMFERQK